MAVLRTMVGIEAIDNHPYTYNSMKKAHFGGFMVVFTIHTYA